MADINDSDRFTIITKKRYRELLAIEYNCMKNASPYKDPEERKKYMDKLVNEYLESRK